MPHKPPGKCIFCGAGNLSREHFWPRWASPLIKCQIDQHVEQIFTFYAVNMKRKDQKTRTRTGGTWTKKFRVVCATCNNGWMNNLETVARPFLTPLISTVSHVVVDASSALAIARWAALKVMVSEHNQRSEAVTSEYELKTFRSTLQLPDNFRIWIARCGVGGWQAAYWRHAATVSASISARPHSKLKNIQSITFGIGDLLFHVLHMTAQDINLGLPKDGAIFQIFPFVEDIAWPPSRIFTANEANVLRDSLHSLINSSRVLSLPFP